MAQASGKLRPHAGRTEHTPCARAVHEPRADDHRPRGANPSGRSRRLTASRGTGNLRVMGFRTPGTGDRLRTAIGEGLREQELLRHHTTFRVGGPADWFVAARTQAQLVAALQVAQALELPCFLLGGGSNLLVSDDGFRGLVVKNAIDDIAFDGTHAQVGCGADYLGFIERCREVSLAGFAYAAGIPGSVGGAIYGNAGCYGQDIGSRVEECTLVSLDGARIETLPAAWFQFAYRDSRVKREPRALLSCVLRPE